MSRYSISVSIPTNRYRKISGRMVSEHTTVFRDLGTFDSADDVARALRNQNEPSACIVVELGDTQASSSVAMGNHWLDEHTSHVLTT